MALVSCTGSEEKGEKWPRSEILGHDVLIKFYSLHGLNFTVCESRLLNVNEETTLSLCNSIVSFFVISFTLTYSI